MSTVSKYVISTYEMDGETRKRVFLAYMTGLRNAEWKWTTNPLEAKKFSLNEARDEIIFWAHYEDIQTEKFSIESLESIRGIVAGKKFNF